MKRYLRFFKISEISILFYISFAGIYGILCVSIYGNFIKYFFNYNCVLQYLNTHLLEFKVLNNAREMPNGEKIQALNCAQYKNIKVIK